MSVPPHVIAASLAALGLYDPRVPVAQLVADSLVDNVPLLEGTHRRLLFEDKTVTADVFVVHTRGHRSLRIDVEPADFTHVVLEQPGHGIRAPMHNQAIDLTEVPPGLTSLTLCRDGGKDPHRTAWVVI
jgi:hypothetical protein